MINNRQNGRRRGRGGNGGGNGQRNGNPGRPDSGNRIDSRARGNANQLYEKYKNLARDAQMSGDRVNTEYYLQFADHYFRVLSESRSRFEEQNPNAPQQRRIQPVDSFDDFDDAEEYGEEGEPIRAGEQAGQDMRPGQEGGRRDGGQDGGQRQGNQRDGNRQQGQPRWEGRRDEPRYGEDRGNAARRNGHAADDADRGADRDVARGDWQGEEARDPQDRFAVTGSPVANDLGEDSPDGAEPSPIAPRRRGRPRRSPQEAGEGSAEMPAAFDADRLPPSLSAAGDAAPGDEEAPRPRRRRARAVNGEAPTLG